MASGRALSRPSLRVPTSARSGTGGKLREKFLNLPLTQEGNRANIAVMRHSPLAGLTRTRTETFRELLRFLGREGRYPTGAELAEALGRTPEATWAMLRALARHGLVERREGVYTLTPAGLELAGALGTTVWRGDDEIQTALRLLGVGHAAEEDRR
jgi:DNA-binding MarR family transcriptional regulator